jgi:hypothetical protein
MIQAGDKIFGSGIQEIGRDTALDFVEQEQEQ